MRITHVMWNAIYGGAETMLADIINQQVEHHDIELVVINDLINKEFLASISPKAKIILLRRSLKSKNPLPIIALNYLVLKSEANIIHFHQDNIIRYLPVRRWKDNLCLTVHSVEIDVEDVKKYNHVFAISPTVCDRVRDLCHVDSSLVVNGINLNKFVKKVAKVSVQTSKLLFKIVLIARLTPLKGHALLLGAVKKLIEKHGFKELYIDFIGDGEIKDELHAEINELGLTDRVRMLGPKSKAYIQEHLHEYDLLVQPSLWEGFGLVAVEGMAANVPVLVANIDGLKDVAKDGEMAYVFKPGNVEDLAAKILEIIRLDENEKREKCKRALEYASAQYDVSRTADEYAKGYESFLEKRDAIHSTGTC
jgi:glycosyltransferase involved in cell wall biosynthesis